jgi:hypothetical protein
MDVLQGPALAAEALSLRVRAEATQGRAVGFDEARVKAYLRRNAIDAAEAIDVMRASLKARNFRRFQDAFDAFLLVARDDEIDDYTLINSIFARLAVRLKDRMASRACSLAERGEDVAGKCGSMAGVVVLGIGDQLARLRKRIGYSRHVEVGRAPWGPPDLPALDDLAGVDEERREYARMNLTRAERVALENHLRKKLPPLGQLATFASIVALIGDRYRLASEREIAHAVEAAERIYDLALYLVD